MRSVLVLCVLAGIAAIGTSHPIAEVAVGNVTEVEEVVAKVNDEEEVSDLLSTEKSTAASNDEKIVKENIIDEALKNADMSENIIPEDIVDKIFTLNFNNGTDVSSNTSTVVTPIEQKTVDSSLITAEAVPPTVETPFKETVSTNVEIAVEDNDERLLDEETVPDYIIPEDFIRSGLISSEDVIPIDEEIVSVLTEEEKVMPPIKKNVQNYLIVKDLFSSSARLPEDSIPIDEELESDLTEKEIGMIPNEDAIPEFIVAKDLIRSAPLNSDIPENEEFLNDPGVIPEVNTSLLNVTDGTKRENEATVDDNNDEAIENEAMDVYNNEQAIEKETVAVDNNDEAIENEAIAIYNNEQVIEKETVAVDNNDQAVENEEVAVDNDDQAIENEAIANNEQAIENEAIAVDNNEQAMENEAVAVFNNEQAMVNEAVAVYNNEQAMENEAVAVFNDEQALENEAVAVYNNEQAMENEAVAVYNNEQAIANEAVAVFNNEEAIEIEPITAYNNKQAMSNEAVAVDYDDQVIKNEAIAVYNNDQAMEADNINNTIPHVEDIHFENSTSVVEDLGLKEQPAIIETIPGTRVTFIETLVEKQPDAIPVYPIEDVDPISVIKQAQYPEASSPMYHDYDASFYDTTHYDYQDDYHYDDLPDNDYGSLTESSYWKYNVHDSNVPNIPDMPEMIPFDEPMMQESDPDYIPEVIPFDEPMMQNSDPDYIPEVIPFDEPIMQEDSYSGLYSDMQENSFSYPLTHVDQTMKRESPMTNIEENNFMESSRPPYLTGNNQQIPSNSDVSYDQYESVDHTYASNGGMKSGGLPDYDSMSDYDSYNQDDSMVLTDTNTDASSTDMTPENTMTNNDLPSFVEQMFSRFPNPGFNVNASVTNDTVTIKLKFSRAPMDAQFNIVSLMNKLIGQNSNFPHKFIGQTSYLLDKPIGHTSSYWPNIARAEYHNTFHPVAQSFRFAHKNPFFSRRYDFRSHLDDIRRRYGLHYQ